MSDEVLRRIHADMTNRGFDALVVASPENFAYAAGFVVPSQPLMRWRHAMMVIPIDGDPGVVVVDMEESTVRDQVQGGDIRVWGEFSDDPMQVLARLLSDGCALLSDVTDTDELIVVR